jgi:hypothetical protein
LAELQRVSEQIAEATGFSQASLVMYILCDIPPALPPLAVTAYTQWHESTGIPRRWITMDFSTGDVPVEEQRRVYREYRKTFATERKKRRRPDDEAFLALVRQYGQPPRGRGSGAMAFWENVRLEWNKARGRELWKTPNAARTHYYRLTKRQKELLGY